ncbi:hypothetical protein [Mycobacterium sp.]|uniref:hypothetical protein n=1 Tax=Mycobacterium sp. TaxID=1785 RepID=UPI002DA57D5C|nr:hypothetical protein [Mycobacterium sp.]
MEVRPYVKAGVAIASAGALIAAMPAITPPAAAPDVTVAAAVPDSVYADIALRQSTQDLFNAFFSGYPDTTGPAGAVGLALLFSDELFGEGSPPSAFVEGGIVGLAAELSAGNPLLEAFFAGGPNDTPGGIVGVLDLLTQGDPLANAFVTGGIVGVADFLTEGNELLNTFVNEGFVGATELVLVNATAGNPLVSQGIQSFFSGYPFEDPVDPNNPDDDLPAGPAGIVGLTHYILDRLAGNPTTPLPFVPGTSGTDALSVEQFSVQDFRAAARTGLPEANEPLEPSDNAITLRTTLKDDPVDPVDPPDTDSGLSVTPLAAFTDSAPAAQPPVAPSPPPTTDPVVDPADPVSNEDDGDANEVTEEELNSGNKVEPDPILFENGTGGGGSAWDETVKRWQDFGAKLGFGGGAANADGETEGSEAGS